MIAIARRGFSVKFYINESLRVRSYTLCIGERVASVYSKLNVCRSNSSDVYIQRLRRTL